MFDIKFADLHFIISFVLEYKNNLTNIYFKELCCRIEDGISNYIDFA